MNWKKFPNIIVWIFFLFSLFYAFKNLFFQSPLSSIEDYKSSIKNLRDLLKREKEENIKLKRIYAYIESHPDESLELFIRDYLQMVKKKEGVFKP